LRLPRRTISRVSNNPAATHNPACIKVPPISFLLFPFVLFSFTLLPRSHLQRFCCVIPAGAALRPPENFVDFDLPVNHGFYDCAGGIPAMPVKTG
jgi:hypothetical protein